MAKELGIVEEATKRFKVQESTVEAKVDVAEEVSGAKSAAADTKANKLYKDVYKNPLNIN